MVSDDIFRYDPNNWGDMIEDTPHETHEETHDYTHDYTHDETHDDTQEAQNKDEKKDDFHTTPEASNSAVSEHDTNNIWKRSGRPFEHNNVYSQSAITCNKQQEKIDTHDISPKHNNLMYSRTVDPTISFKHILKGKEEEEKYDKEKDEKDEKRETNNENKSQRKHNLRKPKNPKIPKISKMKKTKKENTHETSTKVLNTTKIKVKNLGKKGKSNASKGAGRIGDPPKTKESPFRNNSAGSLNAMCKNDNIQRNKSHNDITTLKPSMSWSQIVINTNS